MGAYPDQELPRFRLIVDRLWLSLRIQIPGVVARYECGRLLLTGDGESGTATSRRVVTLDLYHLFFCRLAVVVDGLRPALQIHTWPVIHCAEVLTEITDPSGSCELDGIDFARADRAVGRLQCL